MENLKIDKVEPFEMPKNVILRTIFNLKRCKKEINRVDDTKDFEETLFIDEVLDQDEQ